MRFAVDTGGTFTDLVVEDDTGAIEAYKSPTTPHDPVSGVIDVLEQCSSQRGATLEDLLATGTMFIHGTTRAINAILTGTTAKTALLATEGHPDMLLLREAGRTEPFNWTRPFPDPYIPRRLTFQIPERIGSQGEVVKELDDSSVLAVMSELKALEVEAVAVCLLWSIMNPVHELRIGEFLDKHLPGVPYTLSHALNPVMREFRRASSTALDASLKPLMGSYLRTLEETLREKGFTGRVLMVASNGGVLDATHMAEAPIHSINSGPAMAPVAGRFYAAEDVGSETAVVADTGGTSYDLSLVRRGRIPSTRETWLGPPFMGEITGFPAVDVKSIGAGGGSIAWLDEGGLLHVGPQSAGSVPGPVCYGRGGSSPTVTDASLVLGHIDPEFFLGGRMPLDRGSAERAIELAVARPLSMTVQEAAGAILTIATEHMVLAIEEITVNQGVDPRTAVLVGGGGAAGLNAVAIARRLGCPRVVIPEVGAVLSAAGALMSELTTEYAAAFVTTSGDFDRHGANEVLKELGQRCEAFRVRAGAAATETAIEFLAEARYHHQVWPLEFQLPVQQFDSEQDVELAIEEFHRLHDEMYAVVDAISQIEFSNFRARVSCRLSDGRPGQFPRSHAVYDRKTRPAYFSDTGEVTVDVWHLDGLEEGGVVYGPAVVESPFSTVVVNDGASAERRASGSLILTPWVDAAGTAASAINQTGETVR